MAERLHWFQRLVNRLTIPHKPKHEDALAASRRERFKHIGRRASRRDSYRTYWRENGADVSLQHFPRRQRRAIARRWYRAEKGEA